MTAPLLMQVSNLADKCHNWKLHVYTLKHHSVKAEYLMRFFTDLADSLTSETVNNATRKHGFLDLIITNKDRMEVMEISLMGCTRAILRSITIKNVLAVVRYVNLDIV